MTFARTNFQPDTVLRRVQPTSGASRKTLKHVNALPLQSSFKKLVLTSKWNAGRSSTGRITVWTKGRKIKKNKLPKVNYNFRYNDLCFIGGLLTVPVRNKLLGLLFTSSGFCTYVPLASTYNMFTLTRMSTVFKKKNSLFEQLQFSYNGITTSSSFYLMHQLPKNKQVSLLELYPGKGIQYVRSTGASAKILKMDSRISTSLVKLPSGVKKVFSTHSLGSLGTVALFDNRKWGNTSAGFYNSHGKKPHVRGVAMNPIDHPHGGRTKAIRYPRTPWGKTTKFK